MNKNFKLYRNKHNYKVLAFYKILAEVPGVAREIKKLFFKFFFSKFNFFTGTSAYY